MEFTRGRDASIQVAVQVISVDETIPRSRYVVFRILILKRVSYVESAANVLKSKRGKACRKIWIREVPGQRHEMKRGIEHVHFALMEIGCIQVLARRATINGQTFIDRAVRQRIHVRDDGRDDAASECRDGAVLAGKDKQCRTTVNHKAATAIEHQAGRIPLGAARSWDRKERGGCGADVVERCFSGSVIGNPPR